MQEIGYGNRAINVRLVSIRSIIISANPKNTVASAAYIIALLRTILIAFKSLVARVIKSPVRTLSK